MDIPSTRILQPGEIEQSASAIPEVRLPGAGSAATHFAERVRRLKTLAERDTALSDYLHFLIHLVEAQERSARHFAAAELPLPNADTLARCKTHGMPPLAFRPAEAPQWQDVLDHLPGVFPESAGNPVIAATLARLKGADAQTRNHLAQAHLEGNYDELDPAAGPFIGAALQVFQVLRAERLSADQVPLLDSKAVCPCCGSLPVASVVRIGSAEHGLRYLHCAHCESEWHLPRIHCTHCGKNEKIAYYGIEGGAPGVKAEACGDCNGYLKILYLDKEQHADPIADDLATLAIDLLMDQEGFARNGPNPLFTPGEEPAA